MMSVGNMGKTLSVYVLENKKKWSPIYVGVYI